MPYGRVEVFLGCCGRARKYKKKERIMTHKLIYVAVKLFVPLNYFTDLNVVLCLLFLSFGSSSCEVSGYFISFDKYK